ncbi:hypothetical protein D3C72_2503730 [compost metagenome]
MGNPADSKHFITLIGNGHHPVAVQIGGHDAGPDRVSVAPKQQIRQGGPVRYFDVFLNLGEAKHFFGEMQ